MASSNPTPQSAKIFYSKVRKDSNMAQRETDSRVLVLGGTSKTGRRLTTLLRDGGVPVRSASRAGETIFDWTRRETWAPILAGVATVYLVPPDDPSPTADFVSQAVDTGVRYFVTLSGRGVEHIDGRFGQGMAAAEAAVRSSGVAWTILRPNNFFQNFDEGLWLGPLRSGRLGLPVAGVLEPFIDSSCRDDFVPRSQRANLRIVGTTSAELFRRGCGNLPSRWTKHPVR
jgi:uncharacterized protein YbjT (DUF2867 family)